MRKTLWEDTSGEKTQAVILTELNSIQIQNGAEALSLEVWEWLEAGHRYLSGFMPPIAEKLDRAEEKVIPYEVFAKVTMGFLDIVCEQRAEIIRLNKEIKAKDDRPGTA